MGAEPGVVCVTGGSGFMGRHLARRLLAEGRRVVVLDLAPPPADLLERGATFVPGSVTAPEDVARALEGVEAVVHLAARVRDYGPRAAFLALNVDATRCVLEQARLAGARRVVQMSSVAVFDYRVGYRDADEETPTGGHEYPYGQTKLLAEEAVQAAHGDGLETVIVRPGLTPFGPEDRLTSLRLLDAVERGLPVLLGGGRALLGTSYVENLVDGVVLALDHPAAGGGTFHLCDDARLTWRELVRRLAAVLEVRANLRSFPGGLAYPLAWLVETAWAGLRLRGDPFLTRYRVRTATSDLHFVGARAATVLGYRPAVSLDDALARTVAWYRRARAEEG